MFIKFISLYELISYWFSCVFLLRLINDDISRFSCKISFLKMYPHMIPVMTSSVLISIKLKLSGWRSENQIVNFENWPAVISFKNSISDFFKTYCQKLGKIDWGVSSEWFSNSLKKYFVQSNLNVSPKCGKIWDSVITLNYQQNGSLN